MDDGYYRDKVVLVTGAATGMGRTTALAFAAAGAAVVVADWAEDAGRHTAQEIEDGGGRALFVRTDVGDAGSVAALFERLLDAHGRLDCAINNAGIMIDRGPLADCADDTWSRTLAVNLTGVFLCLRHELRIMAGQGGGAIVNTTSVNALRIMPHTGAYTASKFGVIGLTRMAAVEHGRYGIRVNAIAPGGIHTPMMDALLGDDPERRRQLGEKRPLGRIADPAVIAKAALFLCSDDADHISGHVLPVDGGYVAAA